LATIHGPESPRVIRKPTTFIVEKGSSARLSKN